MAFTSSDETDLLLPLFGAADEAAPFSSFLARVRRRAQAVHASIVIRPGDGREPVSLFVGPNTRRLAREFGLEDLNLTERIQYDRLRPGRVYAADEFDDHDLLGKARRLQDMRKLGLADMRVVRLLDEGGTSAWLIIASDRACTAADSALLSGLAPYVGAAVRAFVAAERRKLADALNTRGLERAGSGWIVFDKAARVLAAAPPTAALLAQALGHPLAPGQRLRALGTATDRALGEAAAAFDQAPSGAQRTLLLLAEPRLEAILAPVSGEAASLLDRPAMMAICRQERGPSAERAGHFARLHALPLREAELAVLLADGLSLAETGKFLGLTIETTRNYSKRLFAALSVRGQTELVRAVYESCSTLA